MEEYMLLNSLVELFPTFKTYLFIALAFQIILLFLWGFFDNGPGPDIMEVIAILGFSLAWGAILPLIIVVAFFHIFIVAGRKVRKMIREQQE